MVRNEPRTKKLEARTREGQDAGTRRMASVAASVAGRAEVDHVQPAPWPGTVTRRLGRQPARHCRALLARGLFENNSLGARACCRVLSRPRGKRRGPRVRGLRRRVVMGEGPPRAARPRRPSRRKTKGASRPASGEQPCTVSALLLCPSCCWFCGHPRWTGPLAGAPTGGRARAHRTRKPHRRTTRVRRPSVVAADTGPSDAVAHAAVPQLCGERWGRRRREDASQAALGNGRIRARAGGSTRRPTHGTRPGTSWARIWPEQRRRLADGAGWPGQGALWTGRRTRRTNDPSDLAVI